MVDFVDFEKENIKKVKIVYCSNIDNKQDLKYSNSFTFIPLKIFWGENTTVIDIKNIPGFKLPYPQTVIINFIKNDAVYKCETTLVEATNVKGFFNLTIENPKTLDRIQQRQYYRVPVAKLVIMGFKDENQDFVRLSATSIDISLGGIKLFNLSTFPENKQISDELMMQDFSNFIFNIYLKNNFIVKCKGDFVRTAKNGDDYTYSFKFSEIDKKIYTKFYRYLVDEQFKQK